MTSDRITPSAIDAAAWAVCKARAELYSEAHPEHKRGEYHHALTGGVSDVKYGPHASDYAMVQAALPHLTTQTQPPKDDLQRRVDAAIEKAAIAGNLAGLYDSTVAEMVFSVARILKGEVPLGEPDTKPNAGREPSEVATPKDDTWHGKPRPHGGGLFCADDHLRRTCTAADPCPDHATQTVEQPE